MRKAHDVATVRAAEHALGGIDLYGGDQLDALTRLNVALHAHALLRRDVDYIVRDGRIQLVSATSVAARSWHGALPGRWLRGSRRANRFPVARAGRASPGYRS